MWSLLETEYIVKGSFDQETKFTFPVSCPTDKREPLLCSVLMTSCIQCMLQDDLKFVLVLDV